MTKTKFLLSLLAALVFLSVFSTSVLAEITTGVSAQNRSIHFNITFVNSTGFVVAPGQSAVPGSLVLVVNVTPENTSSAYIRDNISFSAPNTTFSFALGLNTSNDTDVPSFQGRMNYTIRIWINDSVSSATTPAGGSYAKIDIYGVNLNYTQTAGGSVGNGTVSLQYVPMGNYPNIFNSSGPDASKPAAMLGGFALNMTNLTFNNITVAFPRFGIMPEFIYKCDFYNFSTSAVLDTNRQMAYGCNAGGWGGQIGFTTNNISMNSSHILLNYSYLTPTASQPTKINGTFFGERRYNMRPLIYGENKSVVDVSIVSWANKRPKYFTFVPIFKFNFSNGRMYLASQGYGETMFFGTGVGSNDEASPMEEPNVTEQLVYNLTFKVNATPLAANNPQFVNISIRPRYLNPGVVSGNESVLIPAWNASFNVFGPGSGNKSMNVIFPNLSQIVYGIHWRGNNYICRWQGTVAGTRIHYTNVSNLATLGYPCNATTAEFSLATGEINISVASVNNSLDDSGAGDGAGNDGASRAAGNNTVTMLFMPATNNDPKTGASAFSPIYIMNQTILGFGFTPDINSSAPKIGEGSVMTFFVQFNTTSRNLTTINGTDLIVRFMFPLNVTIWQGAVGTSTVNTSATLGSNMKLWIPNDSRISRDGTYNWTLLANSTHMLVNATSYNAATGAITINGTSPGGGGFANYTKAKLGQTACETCDFFLNRTERNFSFTDNFPFSPTGGRNVTMWFMLFDVNLTAVNGWLPISDPSVSTNITLNLTASVDFKLLTENDQAAGAVGGNTYNSTVSLGQASEVDFADKLQGISSATGVTVYVDGQKNDKYRRGSLIVSFESAGTHTVSFDYNVPSTTAGAAVTPSSAGATTTAVTGKVTKTYTTIAKGASQLISAADLEGTKLTGLTIAVKNAVNSVTVTVEKLAARPSDVSDLTVKKYQYISVSHTNIADADIDKTTFNFKIEKTWFTTNTVDKSKISLYRYADSKWNELTTTKSNEDTDYVYYTATSPGLSTFLIAESSAPGAVAAPTTTTPTPTANVTTPTTPTQPAEQPKAPEKQPQQDNIVIIIGIIVVVIVAGVVVAWKKKLIKI